MKYIKSRNNLILETILTSDDKFRRILIDLEDTNKVASALNSLLFTDVKTNYNSLRVTDRNDMIEFIPDSQFKRIENWKDAFSKKGNKTTIGKLSRSILKDNGYTFTDSEIEEFVNLFKAKYDSEKENSELFKIISGEDITFWYNGDNYVPGYRSPLHKSCMRYEECETYFGIYVENPDKCQMVIYLDEDKKLKARAILWKLDYSEEGYDYFLDRIYYCEESDKNLLIDWVKKELSEYSIGNYYDDAYTEMYVNLKSFKFDKYPYVDTLSYLNINTGKLTNIEQSDRGWYKLQDTAGGYRDDVFCHIEEEFYPREDVVYSNDRQCYISTENARYSKKKQDYFWKEDVVYSERDSDFIPSDEASWSDYLDDYLDQEKSYFVYKSLSGDEWDYYPEDELGKLFAKDSNSDDYYLMDLLSKKEDGGYYIDK